MQCRVTGETPIHSSKGKNQVNQFHRTRKNYSMISRIQSSKEFAGSNARRSTQKQAKDRTKNCRISRVINYIAPLITEIKGLVKIKLNSKRPSPIPKPTAQFAKRFRRNSQMGLTMPKLSKHREHSAGQYSRRMDESSSDWDGGG